MKVLLKKYVCESREQCRGSTDTHYCSHVQTPDANIYGKMQYPNIHFILVGPESL